MDVLSTQGSIGAELEAKNRLEDVGKARVQEQKLLEEERSAIKRVRARLSCFQGVIFYVFLSSCY